jgi:hypothetical protein
VNQTRQEMLDFADRLHAGDIPDISTPELVRRFEAGRRRAANAARLQAKAKDVLPWWVRPLGVALALLTVYVLSVWISHTGRLG